MKTFVLPDLGEGLQEAELLEWLVKEGDTVKEDQLVLLVETAKAVVELPAPASGIISSLKAAEGQTVKVGQPLFEYEVAQNTQDKKNEGIVEDHVNEKHESVSVVGQLSKTADDSTNLFEADYYATSPDESQLTQAEISKSETGNPLKRKAETICMNAFKEAKNSAPRKSTSTPSVAPSTMAFARKLGLEKLLEETHYRELNLYDLLRIYEEQHSAIFKQAGQGSIQHYSENELNSQTPLKGSRKIMAQVMTTSHQQVPAATLFDDVNISHWPAKADVTLRVIQAIVAACKAVPILNTWYEQESMSLQYHSAVHIGLAVNAKTGLYVPVLRDCHKKTEKQIRTQINDYRKQIDERSIPAKDLTGATISLSNFGVLCGRYATPIIVPPQVCIIGVGKLQTEAVVKNNQLEIGRVLPLSLSFDHRAVTGGEAAEFMQHMIAALSC
jgi:pyruvate dehydrogenase E2 component (dihydrolipoamide acetyltransferase)